MPLSSDEIRRRWGRVANVGVPVVGEAGDSWFGQVTVGRAAEPWPRWDGRPLRPLLQVCVRDLPAPAEALADLSYLQLFADFEPDGTLAEAMLTSYPNMPACWAVRTYGLAEPIVGLTPPSDLTPWAIATHQLAWEQSLDAPCWEDTAEKREDWPDDDGLHRTAAIKVGGWPSLIQSEIYWAPRNKHPSQPEFVLQLAAGSGLFIGDSGTIYIGRGTRNHPEEWALDWQCY